MTADVKLATPKQKHLVFTSAGDQANLISWLNGPRNFDLWIPTTAIRRDASEKLPIFTIAAPAANFPTFTIYIKPGLIF